MTERLSMRTIRDILRQRWVLGRPHRAISLSCGRSVGAVYEALRRAQAAGLDWAAVETMTDPALECWRSRGSGEMWTDTLVMISAAVSR